jgi:hypothetical protein
MNHRKSPNPNSAAKNSSIVSVRDLIESKALTTLVSPKATLLSHEKQEPLIFSARARPQSAVKFEYKVPKYSWRVPRLSNPREKRMDYVTLIAEESKPFLNLTKIYTVKKQHVNPPVGTYDMRLDWKKEQNKDQRKG